MSMVRKHTANGFVCAAVVLAGVASQEVAAEPEEGTVEVHMQTNKGEIVLALDYERAPVTVANFVRYVDKGFYDGTIFHRVISTFMIQGGGFSSDMKQKPTDPPIINEWQNGLVNSRGTIAMARTNDPNSATSQFFINVVDNPRLSQPMSGGAAYAVFGHVIKGMDVVDAIKAIPTENKGGAFASLPTEKVVIEKVTWSGPKTLEELNALAKNPPPLKPETSGPNLSNMSVQEQMDLGRNLVEKQGGDLSKGVTTDSGLWYVDQVVGEGSKPKKTAFVVCHYTGWFPDGKVFDTSRDKPNPVNFQLFGVIKGWTEGVGNMQKGGKRFMVIPPDLAYGPEGRPGRIPPNSVLVFEVELVDIK